MDVESSTASEEDGEDEEDQELDSEEDDWAPDWQEQVDGLSGVPWEHGLSAEDRLGVAFDRETAAARNTGELDGLTSVHVTYLVTSASLSPSDHKNIRGFNFKVKTDLGDTAYGYLPQAFPELSDLESIYRLQRRMTFLSGLTPERYDCCRNSCICYTGRHDSLRNCPFCDLPRFDSSGRPFPFFQYLPLIPRLRAIFENRKESEEMDYRSKYKHVPGMSSDVFDGKHYRRLKKTRVVINQEVLPQRFFEGETDVAMGLSTDGFGPFKKRKQTCWPLIGFNYNLPPTIRFHIDRLICFGVIPGPRQPKDMDSFLWPLVQEFLRLARGVSAYDVRMDRQFTLHAYLILAFGDLPAIAKLMHLKGHNGFCPCRACMIVGTNGLTTTYYTPLTRIPPASSYNPLRLPLCSHDAFLRLAEQVDNARTDAEEEELSRECGIKGVPILSTLPSLDFPNSFPHGFMHLVFENTVPTLLDLWTNNFKGIDVSNEGFAISKSVFEAVG